MSFHKREPRFAAQPAHADAVEALACQEAPGASARSADPSRPNLHATAGTSTTMDRAKGAARDALHKR